MTTMSSTPSASQVRQKLLQASLDCVKKCQVRYGGKTELAIGEEESVQELCKQIELILSHGLKDKDTHLGLAVIRNVRDLVGGGEVEGRTLWNLLKSYLNPTEQQRFLLLTKITTDLGRGRAWVRSSLNEQSLERFLQSLLRDKVKLANVYEEWAFLRDEERSVMMPSMAAGLTSVRFAIRIDDPALNGELEGVQQVHQVFSSSLSAFLPTRKPTTTFASSTSASASHISNPEIASSAATAPEQVITTGRVRAKAKVKKKRLRSCAQVVSFDDTLVQPVGEMAEEATTPTCLVSPFSTQSTDDSFLFAERTGQDTDSAKTETSPALSHKANDKTDLSSSDVSSVRNSSSRLLSASGNNSSLSLGSSTSDREQLQKMDFSFESVSLDGQRKELQSEEFDFYGQSETSDTRKQSQFSDALTPVTNKDVGALFLVQPGDTSRLSMDLDSLDQAEFDYAPSTDGHELPGSNRSAHGDSLSCTNTESRESKKNYNSHDQSSAIGREDLRKALLSVMEKKEDLEKEMKSLRTSLDKEVLANRDLKTEIDNLQQQRTEQVEKLESRNTIFSRENELLKHQLKKYVGAVQKLRDGPQAYETLAQLESQNETREINQKYVDYHYEASEYEKKLIQVAEMHGELLEFNESLQKCVQAREQVINRLRAELVLLRGPLPEEQHQLHQENGETSSLASSSEASLSSGRVLVNIWIPSVFLTGSGSDRHHVYQVYVRIRDEEWNVYRRYNQFLQMHQQTKKADPVVASFHFPPKKTMGNRSERFVEIRRKQLQTYLRNIVNYLVSTHDSLANCPDKESLVSILPFFSDAPPSDTNTNNTRPSILRRHSREQLSRIVI